VASYNDLVFLVKAEGGGGYSRNFATDVFQNKAGPDRVGDSPKAKSLCIR